MYWRWLKNQLRLYYGDTEEKGHTFYAWVPGGLEIALIVVAVILVFGVGKLAHVGGALGKSIREFRREKDRVDEPPQLTPKEPREELSPPKAESKD